VLQQDDGGDDRSGVVSHGTPFRGPDARPENHNACGADVRVFAARAQLMAPAGWTGPNRLPCA
jgi:hypothetical protein